MRSLIYQATFVYITTKKQNTIFAPHAVYKHLSPKIPKNALDLYFFSKANYKQQQKYIEA